MLYCPYMKKIEERFTLTKKERLTGTIKIDTLFKEGISFISFPLRVIYLVYEQRRESMCSILVSVPKKRIKKASQRNRIKRLIRESYRLNKTMMDYEASDYKSLDIAFIYVKDDVSDYPTIQKAMQKALSEITDRIKKTEQGE